MKSCLSYKSPNRIWQRTKIQNLKTFSPGTVNSRFMTYKESDDTFESINPLNNTFDANGKGYAIRAANNSGTTLGTFVGNFVGNLNNGEKSIFSPQMKIATS